MSLELTGLMVGMETMPGRDGKQGFRTLSFMSIVETENGQKADILKVVDFDMKNDFQNQKTYTVPVQVNASAGKGGKVFVNYNMIGNAKTINDVPDFKEEKAKEGNGKGLLK